MSEYTSREAAHIADEQVGHDATSPTPEAGFTHAGLRPDTDVRPDADDLDDDLDDADLDDDLDDEDDEELDPLDDADELHATTLQEDIVDLHDDDDEQDDLDDEDDDLDEDDDDDLDDDEDDDDDDFDDLEDATDEDVDLVVALYREDGEPVAMSLPWTLANDLDELIVQLRRLPADAGVAAMVSIAGEFFVIVRVRGRNVQVLLSDVVSANDWPLARDVVDLLGIEVPDPDDDSEPVGDLTLLADQGLSDFDLETWASDLDEDSDQLLERIAARINFGEQFRRAVATRR